MTNASNIVRSLAGAALLLSLAGSAALADNGSSNNAMLRADGSELTAAPVAVSGSWAYTFASWENNGSFGALPAVKIVSAPAHGSVQLGTGFVSGNNVPAGTIEGTQLTYQPAAGYKGDDSITYQVSEQLWSNAPVTTTNTYTVHFNVQ